MKLRILSSAKPWGFPLPTPLWDPIGGPVMLPPCCSLWRQKPISALFSLSFPRHWYVERPWRGLCFVLQDWQPRPTFAEAIGRLNGLLPVATLT
jgi:hypothetical protein